MAYLSDCMVNIVRRRRDEGERGREGGRVFIPGQYSVSSLCPPCVVLHHSSVHSSVYELHSVVLLVSLCSLPLSSCSPFATCLSLCRWYLSLLSFYTSPSDTFNCSFSFTLLFSTFASLTFVLCLVRSSCVIVVYHPSTPLLTVIFSTR